jgi:hypothetical protein
MRLEEGAKRKRADDENKRILESQIEDNRKRKAADDAIEKCRQEADAVG